MRKYLYFLGLLLCGQLAFAAPIRFAMEATYPPFEYIDANGEIMGFDVDIAKALCLEMKVECTFSNQSFASLIPSLQLGKYDAVISALAVTPERLQQVNFTHSYYEPSAAFVGVDSGNVIGVQQGSVFEKYLEDKYNTTIVVKAYGSIQDAFLDLDAGRVDRVIADTPIANEWLMQSDKKFHMVGKPIVDNQYFGSGYGIAVSKNNPDLLQALNKALANIKANGVYASIVKKYFGEH
jgi:arginine transport system substrate-binding protein